MDKYFEQVRMEDNKMANGINTHGININIDSLKQAAKSTVNNPNGSSYLFYDRCTGDVFESWQPNGNWVEYRDPDVVFVMATPKHVSAQRIADAIYETLEEEARLAERLSGWDPY